VYSTSFRSETHATDSTCMVATPKSAEAMSATRRRSSHGGVWPAASRHASTSAATSRKTSHVLARCRATFVTWNAVAWRSVSRPRRTALSLALSQASTWSETIVSG
jgi:hypothetical protein